MTGQDELQISAGIKVQWASPEIVVSSTKGTRLNPMPSLRHVWDGIIFPQISILWAPVLMPYLLTSITGNCMLLIRWQTSVPSGRLIHQILLPTNPWSWSLERLWYLSEHGQHCRWPSRQLTKDYHWSWAEVRQTCWGRYYHLESNDDKGMPRFISSVIWNNTHMFVDHGCNLQW